MAMSRFSVTALGAAVLSMVVLAGCGGGGGGSSSGSSNTNPTTPSSSGGITGSVVGSLDSNGVSGVVIRLGSAGTATTDASGKFTVNVGSSGVQLPISFQVDVTAAPSTVDRSAMVTYNAQTYDPSRVDMPAAILNGSSTNLGTITVVETSGDSPPPVPFPSNDTLIYGLVLSKKLGTGVANVKITFGTTSSLQVSATTGKNGYFALDLGRDQSVFTYYPLTTGTFSVDTSGAGSSYPTSLQVSYNSNYTPQSTVVVPNLSDLSSSRDLGTIYIVDDNSTGDNPPGIPVMPFSTTKK